MTSEEIVTIQRRYRRLNERSKMIVAELRNKSYPDLGIQNEWPAMLREAADVIEWLLEQNAALRKDIDDAIRDGQQAAQDEYTEGFLEGMHRGDDW